VSSPFSPHGDDRVLPEAHHEDEGGDDEEDGEGDIQDDASDLHDLIVEVPLFKIPVSSL
jgi:hypothetical protein